MAAGVQFRRWPSLPISHIHVTHIHYLAALKLFTHALALLPLTFISKYIFYGYNLQLAGDPKPMVTWHRENGVLPQDRSRILLDNTLRIEDARPEDQGRYICNGQNEGGNVTATVKLYVYGKC